MHKRVIVATTENGLATLESGVCQPLVVDDGTGCCARSAQLIESENLSADFVGEIPQAGSAQGSEEPGPRQVHVL
jgi:hypothetical protein